MEEFRSIYDDQYLLPEDEMSMALFSETNPNRLLLFLLPIALLFLLRPKNNNPYPPAPYPPTPYSRQGTDTYKPKGSPLAFDSDMLDKMRIMLDGVKKAQTIQGLRKNMSQSAGKNGKMNMDVMKELLGVMGDSLGENNKSQIHNVTNMMSMFEKIKDVKKVLDVQKASKSESEGDNASQINNLIDLIGPMLPEELSKNVESFKKMGQMMKFMSAFEDSGESESDDEYDSEEYDSRNEDNSEQY